MASGPGAYYPTDTARGRSDSVHYARHAAGPVSVRGQDGLLQSPGQVQRGRGGGQTTDLPSVLYGEGGHTPVSRVYNSVRDYR